MTEAATLRCPSCGASVPPEVTECGHCHVALHPVRCPWCFDWTFTEARDCPRCGSHAEPSARKVTCPSCRQPLTTRRLGNAALSECMRCAELMNRFNFANCSGVILDSCRPHGVWFDPDELRRIVEFIRGGGLDVAREKERLNLELERRRFEHAAGAPERRASDLESPIPDSIGSARDLLRFMFDQ